MSKMSLNTYNCSNCNRLVTTTRSYRNSKGELVCLNCKKLEDPNYGKLINKDYICSRCGKSVKSNFILTDDNGNKLCLNCKKIINPDYNKMKVKEFVCSNCGKLINSIYSYRSASGNIICKDCKKLETPEFDKRDKRDLKTYTCSKCGKVVTSKIIRTSNIDKSILCFECKKIEDPNYSSLEDYYRNKLNDMNRIDKLADSYSYRYEYIDSYIDKTGYRILKFRCKICGIQFEKSSKDLWVGRGKLFECPNKDCDSYQSSTQELEIRDYIRSILNDNTISRSSDLIRNPKTHHPVEIDIYIPKFNIGIEYDGVHWHNNIDKSYKYSECKDIGIRLIQIMDYEWVTKNKLIRSYIKSLFNLFNVKIGARKCEVREITSKEYSEFTEANHLQGYAPASVKLGLYYNNELVQIVSFSKSRFDKSIDWEFMRECSKLGYNIIGGKSKLLKYFINNYNPKSIVSYCDKSKFSGKSYLDCGFNLESETSNSYYYYKNDIIINRVSAQKYKLSHLLDKFDPNLTEEENMFMNGWSKLYNFGNYKFVWRNNIGGA